MRQLICCLSRHEFGCSFWKYFWQNLVFTSFVEENRCFFFLFVCARPMVCSLVLPIEAMNVEIIGWGPAAMGQKLNYQIKRENFLNCLYFWSIWFVHAAIVQQVWNNILNDIFDYVLKYILCVLMLCTDIVCWMYDYAYIYTTFMQVQSIFEWHIVFIDVLEMSIFPKQVD